MEFGVQLPHFGPLVSGRGTLELAQRAEALGYDAVWVSDHIVYPATFAERFGTAVYEAVTTLTWVGAITQRIRLGTAVLIAPYRNPLLLAKQLATLDDLSGGRTIIGMGAGWMKEEFDALGATFADRGVTTDEHLDIMAGRCGVRRLQVIWVRVISFPPLCADPRPVQQPAPPIWIGGNSQAALRRAARFGEGWLPIWHAPTQRGFSPYELSLEIERLAQLTHHTGRSVTHAIGGLMPLALSREAIPPRSSGASRRSPGPGGRGAEQPESGRAPAHHFESVLRRQPRPPTERPASRRTAARTLYERGRPRVGRHGLINRSTPERTTIWILAFVYPHYGKPIEISRILEIAKRAETLGFDSVWVTDHLIVPASMNIIYRGQHARTHCLCSAISQPWSHGSGSAPASSFCPIAVRSWWPKCWPPLINYPKAE